MLVKTCTTCHEPKAIEHFRDHPLGKYGKRAICRPCQNAYYLAWLKANPDKVRAKRDKRIDEGKRKIEARGQYYKHHEANRARRKEWGRQFPEQVRAHGAVRNALRDGYLERGPCEFREVSPCAGIVQAHHDDYSKHLDVRWICIRHHRRLHRDAKALGKSTSEIVACL